VTGPLGAVGRLVVAAAIGFAFGTLASSTPPAREAGVAWFGQFAAPWVALPWLVGWGVVGRGGGAALAAASGIVASVAAVHGYYVHPWELDPLEMELPTSTPWPALYLTVTMRNLGGAAVWFVAGAASGGLMAWLGWRYRRTGELLAGAVLPAAFILEPIGQFVVFGRLDRPEWIWALEAALGVGLLVWMMRSGRRAASPGVAAT
jgi:hypothetical protein